MASPPPYGQCNINEPNLTLDYSIGDQKSLNGNKASGTLTVSCNQKTDLKMYIIADPASRVKLAESLTSQLTINGAPAATGVQFVGSDTSYALNIVSTLQTNGRITFGEYNTTTIAVISYLWPLTDTLAQSQSRLPTQPLLSAGLIARYQLPVRT